MMVTDIPLIEAVNSFVSGISSYLSGIEIGGLGFGNPIALLGIPLGIIALFHLILRRRDEGDASRRSRILLFMSRLLIVVLVLGAIAAPYTVESKETQGNPRVKMLIDNSDSMSVYPDIGNQLVKNIEAQGVPVDVIQVGSDNSSSIGDSVISNLEQNGSILLLSDGQVTKGRSLKQAGALAKSVNARIHAVNLSNQETERSIGIHGPSKTSAGVDNKFLVEVRGVVSDKDIKAGTSDTRVVVKVDGKPVKTKRVKKTDRIEFQHVFKKVGEHRITAEIRGSDIISTNNVFYKTVRVVKKPKILYISRSKHKVESILKDLYNVEKAKKIPSREKLKDYYAVVIHDVAADDLGNIGSLQEYAIDGNGVVVIGGPNSYDKGDYKSSTIAGMLPVKVGESDQTSKIVIAIDISKSTTKDMSVQKALALDAVSQLGDSNKVGVVAFNDQAYKVAELQKLLGSRNDLRDKIRRLENGGPTQIGSGIRGAGDALGWSGGNVILISDGITLNKEGAYRAARRIKSKGGKVITVGVGQKTNRDVMKKIAREGGGTFFKADETDRLRILFGGSKKADSEGLTIVDSSHFITTGIKTSSDPSQANKVSVKKGADYLVASGSGKPAISSWRYGLGRVVSVTAYGEDGSLDGLLSRPDSLLISKSINWAIGDPERKESGVIYVSDARLGEATKVTYIGEERPSIQDLSFSKVGEKKYEATLVPKSKGFEDFKGSEYAVNYPREYSDFGFSPRLQTIVSDTGGKIFEPDQASTIAKAVKERSTTVRRQRVSWEWLALLLALIIYLAEVMTRRIYEVYGYRLPLSTTS